MIIRVRDEGIGIEQDRLKNLTQLFKNSINRGVLSQDASNSFTSMKEGAGLGLSTSKYLLEVQGGTLGIKSKVNEFTEVTLSIRVDYKTVEAENPSADDISQTEAG